MREGALARAVASDAFAKLKPGEGMDLAYPAGIAADALPLLGDAAHPMYPIGSNGASQAILGARRLTWHLASGADVEEALQAYDAERRPATAQIVLANRQNGPEKAMEMVHERAPDGFENLSDIVSASELSETADHYKALAGFDKDTLNNRPSWNAVYGA